MVARIASIAPLLAVLALTACGGAEPDDEPSADEADELKKCGAPVDWRPDMFESFDAWDDARWTKEDGLVPPRTKTCYTAANVDVRDGMLRIATRDESVCGGQPYSGGGVTSYGKFWTGKYFKAEIRAKVSQEKGIFGAPIWFRPGNAAGATTVGGEIDVVESLGSWDTPKFQQTLHPDYGDTQSHFVYDHTRYDALGDKAGTEFHVYTVVKVPNGITFYTDGKRTAGWGCGHPDNLKRPAYFKRWFEDTPDGWSIRIDNKVGGPWAGDPGKTTSWGAKTAMEIDYIKVWRPR